VEAICPYCLSEILSEEEMTACEECGSELHRECWDENGGCTVFGCKLTPAEELKVSVHASEIEEAIPHSYSDPPPPRDATAEPPPFPAGMQSPPPLAFPSNASVPSFGGHASVFRTAPARLVVPSAASLPKNRITYILLAVFLGPFGVHNFYADRPRRAAAQLVISCVSFLLLSPVIWIWGIVDCFVIETDGKGRRMH
jgi:TM2 domain-containing membrane protein YozV